MKQIKDQERKKAQEAEKGLEAEGRKYAIKQDTFPLEGVMKMASDRDHRDEIGTGPVRDVTDKKLSRRKLLSAAGSAAVSGILLGSMSAFAKENTVTENVYGNLSSADKGNGNAEGIRRIVREELQAVEEKYDAQFAETELKNKYFKKSVYKQFPLRFPDFNTIVAQEGVSYIYPQSFTIDWDADELFMVYEPAGGSSTKRWVAVYELSTKQYKTCFHAGNAGGEGIVVKTEGQDRWMYVKTRSTYLGKFLINTLPPRLSSLSPAAEYNVGLSFEFSYRNGVWLVEQANSPLGFYHRRTSFSLYDDQFNLIGTMNIASDIGGYLHGGAYDSAYGSYVPKRQAIGLADGFIILGCGGNYRPSITPVPTPSQYQGLKILSTSGEMIAEAIIDPKLMIDELNRQGYQSDRIEMEGIHIAPNGEIYTLMVNLTSITNPITLSEGLILFKECSSEADAIDFSKHAAFYPRVNPSFLESKVFPLSADGKMYDPYKGTVLDTFDKILDLMVGLSLGRFSFYSSSLTVSVKDINGTNVPTGTLVVITNANNNTFFAEFLTNPTCRKFIIWGQSGSRRQVQIYDAQPTN